MQFTFLHMFMIYCAAVRGGGRSYCAGAMHHAGRGSQQLSARPDCPLIGHGLPCCFPKAGASFLPSSPSRAWSPVTCRRGGERGRSPFPVPMAKHSPLQTPLMQSLLSPYSPLVCFGRTYRKSGRVPGEMWSGDRVVGALFLTNTALLERNRQGQSGDVAPHTLLAKSECRDPLYHI